MFEDNQYGKVNLKYREWVRRLPCLCGLGCYGYVYAHHVRSKGAGGKDEGNLVPLCNRHHVHGVHQVGRKTFERSFDINLKAEAERIWDVYKKNVHGAS